MSLTDRQRHRLALTAMGGGMYPGDLWEHAPKQFAELERMGLVRLFTPHNPVHKDRAVITELGRKALADAEAKRMGGAL